MMALALFLIVAAPLGVGLALGLGVRRVRGRRVSSAWSALAFLLGPTLLLLALPLSRIPVSCWDLLQVAALLGGGLFFGLHEAASRVGWGRWALAGSGVLAGLLMLEIGSRLLPEPVGFFPDPAGASLLLNLEGEGALDDWQQAPMAFPQRSPGAVAERLRFAKAGLPRVLHVGDSMVHGTTIGLASTWVARLDARDPDHSHVNLGVPGTGPDYYALVIRNWCRLGETSEVVLYLLGDSDLRDIDRRYLFCGGGSLMRYADGRADYNCPDPRWSDSVADLLWNHPPPFVVRVLSRASAGARHLVAAHWRLAAAMRGRGEPERGLRALEMLLRRLHSDLTAEGIELTVVALPFRGLLERNADPQGWPAEYHRKVVDLSKGLGIRTFDALPTFVGAAVVQRGPLFGT